MDQINFKIIQKIYISIFRCNKCFYSFPCSLLLVIKRARLYPLAAWNHLQTAMIYRPRLLEPYCYRLEQARKRTWPNICSYTDRFLFLCESRAEWINFLIHFLDFFFTDSELTTEASKFVVQSLCIDARHFLFRVQIFFPPDRRFQRFNSATEIKSIHIAWLFWDGHVMR